VVVPIPDEGIGKEDTDTEVEPIQPSASLKTGNSNKTKVSGNSSSKADTAELKFILKLISGPIRFFATPFKKSLHIIGKGIQGCLVWVFVVLMGGILIYALGWVAYERLIEHHSFHWCFETMVSSVTKTNDEPEAVEKAKPTTVVVQAPTQVPQTIASAPVTQPTIAKSAKPVVKLPKKSEKYKIPADAEIVKGDDADFASAFTGYFYGLSYKSPSDWVEYFQRTIDKDHIDAFMN
jgi:hypothetical protein